MKYLQNVHAEVSRKCDWCRSHTLAIHTVKLIFIYIASIYLKITKGGTFSSCGSEVPPVIFVGIEAFFFFFLTTMFLFILDVYFQGSYYTNRFVGLYLYRHKGNGECINYDKKDSRGTIVREVVQSDHDLL